MNRGLLIGLVAAVLLLAVGVAGLGAYVFLGSGARSGEADAAGTSGDQATMESVVFFETKNFVTDLADKERLRYVDVTISLAVKDEAALEETQNLEPQIRDIVLGQLRQRTATELAGTAGKEQLAEALQTALQALLKDRLVRVYITDLVIQ